MINNVLSIGQRWLSDAEPELGLGVVVETDTRSMTVLFPVTDESRVYAKANAPLTRIQFSVGDEIEDIDGERWLVVGVSEARGLLKYRARPILLGDSAPDVSDEKDIMETRISPLLQLSRPKERMLAAQIEPSIWFRLRLAASRHRLRLELSPVRGLLGARISLIPHQLSVAASVSSRLQPRVLLADEVGLGKTIEAGLILHAQYLQGHAQRILVLVPDSLIHQWLVEMRRRFNLAFSLFDLARCAAFNAEGENPFASEQLVLAPLSLMVDHPDLLTAAMANPWDILVVDEAHHLAWSPEEGASADYETVALLAENIPGLLLLTATPEQLGLESHFARLRLLDPARYPSLEAFVAEHDQWDLIRELADGLLDNTLSDSQADELKAVLHRSELKISTEQEREAILQELLDRHGLGRVLFRNTRAAVGGFPRRHCQPALLPSPEAYDALIAKGAIWPETRVDESTWLASDPRIPWLVSWLKQHRREKVLLITRTGPITEALENHLRMREGIRTAVFNESMSLLERDRAAAYFADMESGAQILLCSEIGSEGRNFQFAHHLILLDLPDNPDQLEQRIGRLDRIGQSQTIQIHVPIIEGSAQSRLFRWYDEALDVFSRCSPAASAVHEHYLAELKPMLKPSAGEDSLNALIDSAQMLRQAFEEDLAGGRDRLLELQSCRRAVADQLVNLLAADDADTRLDTFMLAAWEAFGVHVEDHGANRTWILQPGEHQLIEHFPGLDPESMTVCADRQLALAHEDWDFLTWEHPMVTGLLEWLGASSSGCVQVAVLKKTAVKAGTLLLEAWFEAAVQAPKNLAIARTLPNEPIRFLLDARGQNLADKVAADGLARQLEVLDLKLSRQVIKSHRDEIEQLIAATEKAAATQEAAVQAAALNAWTNLEAPELSRLQALQVVNPSIRSSEVQAQMRRLAHGEQALSQLSLKLTALRLIIAA